MPLDRSKCILCGAEPPLTGEHIWPDWYSRLHPERNYELESIMGDEEPSYRPANSLDLKPEVLCPDCNNRWGSTFENRVRPYIEPMADGRDHIVSDIAARRLAAWLCLKAMVAEHLAEDRSFHWAFFHNAERAHLRRTAHPPECVKGVWIGRYVGARRHGGWLRDQRLAVPFSAEPETIAELYVTTLAIGQLVFQIVAVHVVPVDPNEQRDTVQGFLPLVIDGPWHDTLIQIWPMPKEPAEWPPPLAFDDNGFQALVERWTQHHPRRQVKNDPAPE